MSASGLAAGAAAALGYTLAASFLRELSKSVDPAWVATIKAVTTTTLFVPVLLYFAWRGVRLLPPPKVCLGLIFAGVFVQLAGNLAFQWALGVIGLALVVPLTMGTMVVFSAIGGQVILKEKVNRALAIALVVLIVSVFVLCLGGQKAGQAVGNLEQPWMWMMAGLAACTAGFSFAVLGIAIRTSLKSEIPYATPMVFVGVCGLIVLGSASVGRLGWGLLETTPPRAWLLMFAAGLCNAFAFLALTLALKRLPVIYVNAINISQVAMATLVGLYIFAEPISAWLALGLFIMLVGFVVLGWSSRAART